MTLRGSRRWWFWSLLPFGLGSWAPIYAGVRARVPPWIALGMLWSALSLTGWVVAGTTNGESALAGLSLIVGWVGGIATSFLIRERYIEQTTTALQAALHAAGRQLTLREQAQTLARERPALAAAAGIGRPDRPDAYHAGLVDINNASVAAIGRLPGVDQALAARIVDTRRQTRGFSSVEDLGIVLDLDAPLVEALRARTVFLPAEPEAVGPV